MPWLSTPRATIDNSSDDTDDDDYQERPAKRRKWSATPSAKKGKKTKLGEREAGQSSFTQVDYLSRMKAPRRSDMDADGFQMWQDSETEEDVLEDAPYTSRDARFGAPSTTSADDSEDMVPEIAESSQNGLEQDSQGDAREKQPDGMATRLRTPQKVRFVEVPSSQTPPGTKQTAQRLRPRQPSISRSPLKEKPANATSPLSKLRSPASQDMSMKMLERTRFANQKARRVNASAENGIDQDLERCAAEASDDFSLRTCPMPPPPSRHLRRTTTVQDSQAEDVEALGSTVDDAGDLEPAGTIPDSQRASSNEAIVEDSQYQRPPRKLKRVATVQDSQIDEDDIEHDVDMASRTQCNYLDEMAHDLDEDLRSECYPDGTYDPAVSALDRDADRFSWAHTQHFSTLVDEDAETEDEEIAHVHEREAVQLPDTIPPGPSQELGGALDVSSLAKEKFAPPSSSDYVVSAGEDFDAVQVERRDDSAYESGDQVTVAKAVEITSSRTPREETATREEARIPSSPPLLRASQVSTVVPTQASVALRAASPQRPVKPEPVSQPPPPGRHGQTQAFGVFTSPYMPSSLWQPESLSSSPLPLPPWTSPQAHGTLDHGADFGIETQLDSLADFSLPPPPPMSSSRRQTPASSSV